MAVVGQPMQRIEELTRKHGLEHSSSSMASSRLMRSAATCSTGRHSTSLAARKSPFV